MNEIEQDMNEARIELILQLFNTLHDEGRDAFIEELSKVFKEVIQDDCVNHDIELLCAELDKIND